MYKLKSVSMSSLMPSLNRYRLFLWTIV